MLKAHPDSTRYRACPQRMSARYRTVRYGTAQPGVHMRICRARQQWQLAYNLASAVSCVDEWCRTSPYIDARVRTATCVRRRTQCEHGLSVRKYLDLCKIHGFSAEPYGSARTADLRQKARHTQLSSVFKTCSVSADSSLQNRGTACGMNGPSEDRVKAHQITAVVVNKFSLFKNEITFANVSKKKTYICIYCYCFGEDLVLPSTSVRNLGIFFDADLSMRTHVQRTVAGCFAALRKLRSIRRSVPASVYQTLVVELVLSPLEKSI